MKEIEEGNFHKIHVTTANSDIDICSPCGGRCCRNMPGIVFPMDLDPNLSPPVLEHKIVELLKTGRYTLDWWEGPPVDGPFANEEDGFTNGFYIRPATVGNEGKKTDPSYGGVCTFWTLLGCSLSESDRPGECKALIPKEGGLGKCEMPEGWQGRKTGALAWWPFRRIMHRVLWRIGEMGL